MIIFCIFKILKNRLTNLNILNRKFIFCTIHRVENIEDEDVLTILVSLLNEISEEKLIIFPLHPRTKEVFKE